MSVTLLARGWEVQRRVVKALVLREIITRYGRHNVGFMWLFVEPMLFTLGVLVLWSATRAVHGSQLPIIPFALTGYSSVLLWRNAANRCAKAIEPNKSLLAHRNVRVQDFFTARLILEIGGATTSFLGLGLAFVAVGWMEPPADLLQVVYGWTMLAWFASALGLIVGAVSERSEAIDRVWHTLTYLLFPLSGAAFMVDWLPSSARELALWMPTVNGTEMIRAGFFGEAVRTYYDVGYFATCNLCLSLCGLMLVADTARRVEGE